MLIKGKFATLNRPGVDLSRGVPKQNRLFGSWRSYSWGDAVTGTCWLFPSWNS